MLIVDDEEGIRSMLYEYFTSRDFEVVTASDGEEALRKFVPGSYDLVISDMMMPHMDGIELLTQIKLMDKNTSFLMITGFPSIDRAVEAIKLGAHDFVTKPFHLEELRIKVERVFSEKKTEASLRNITNLFWTLIISIPIWLVLGIILGIIWK
jgi:two-component system response regulator PilR (NtrC family)